jgi:hypothetical protein
VVRDIIERDVAARLSFADARPNWREQAERPSLTGTQWRN